MIPASKIETVVRCCSCGTHRTASNGWFECEQNGVELKVRPMAATGVFGVVPSHSYVCSDSCLAKIVQGYANEIRGAKTIHGKE